MAAPYKLRIRQSALLTNCIRMRDGHQSTRRISEKCPREAKNVVVRGFSNHIIVRFALVFGVLSH